MHRSDFSVTGESTDFLEDGVLMVTTVISIDISTRVNCTCII